jgi:hypothetical protein
MQNKKPKAVWIVTTVIALVAIIGGTYYVSRTEEQATSSNAAADVTLNFNTPNLNSNINTVLTPRLIVSPTTNQVTAVEVYLTFDKNKLSINSITNATKFGTVLKAPVIDNNAGTASFTLGINGGVGITPVPVTVVSDVVNISLTTKAIYGSTTINVATNSRVSAKGVDTSVLGTYGQMVINIINSASPAPSPTSSSTTYPAWDVDQSGTTNIVDIGLIVDNYGSNAPTNSRVDVNGDGTINVIDIGVVVDHYQ